MPNSESCIVVAGNEVINLEKWTIWNGTPDVTLKIAKLEDGSYKLCTGNPEHGGSQSSGPDLKKLLADSGLHHDFQTRYFELFQLKNPTDDQIRQLAPGYEVFRR